MPVNIQYDSGCGATCVAPIACSGMRRRGVPQQVQANADSHELLLLLAGQTDPGTPKTDPFLATHTYGHDNEFAKCGDSYSMRLGQARHMVALAQVPVVAHRAP